MRELRVGDITADSEWVLVQVRGKRERLVPVLETWESPPPFTCSTMPQPTVSRSVWNVRARLAAMPSRKYVQRRRGIGLKPQTQRMRGRRIVNHLAWGTPWCGTGWPLRRETGQRRAALCGQVIPSACACALQPHSLPDRCKQVIQRLVESTCKE